MSGKREDYWKEKSKESKRQEEIEILIEPSGGHPFRYDGGKTCAAGAGLGEVAFRSCPRLPRHAISVIKVMDVVYEITDSSTNRLTI